METGAPILGVISDAQESIRLAVAETIPGVPHQLCQFHVLRDASAEELETELLEMRVEGESLADPEGLHHAEARRIHVREGLVANHHTAACGEPPDVDGDAVTVESQRGAARFTARVTDATRPGVVVIEGIWWHRFHPDGRGVNVLTSDRVTDLGGGPAFHSNLVEVSRV